MKKITITIETENDAFQNGGLESGELELNHILRDLASEIMLGRFPSKLLDSNGNTVGRVEIED